MKEARFVGVEYRCSETRTVQGSENSIKGYLKKGFYVKESRNGFWVLVKPTQILVTLEGSGGTIRTFNMKRSILDCFGKTRTSQKLVADFLEFVKSGRITFKMDESSDCYEFIC